MEVCNSDIIAGVCNSQDVGVQGRAWGLEAKSTRVCNKGRMGPQVTGDVCI
jgi:hypothetical protein